MQIRWLALLCLAPLAACAEDEIVDEETPVEMMPGMQMEEMVVPKTGLAIFGYEAHDMAMIDFIDLPNGSLNVPRALAFNHETELELWVVNRADDSMVTYTQIGEPSMDIKKRIDPFALHFMEEVSSIAFGAPGRFATCQESRNTYGGESAANDFMGPTLWSTDPQIFAKSNPAAVRELGYDLGSHLDMLHESPLCAGIAWDHDNVYWTFDGLTNSISRYDFQTDHGPGFDDHADGVIDRYGAGEMAFVPNIPSHLAFDYVTGLLYIADTGHGRVAVLDTATGTRGSSMRVKEPGTQLHSMNGAVITTLTTEELEHPSGIVLGGDYVFVSDNATSRISAFSKTTGTRVDYLDLPIERGGLMGISFDGRGRLYAVDGATNRLVRIAAQ